MTIVYELRGRREHGGKGIGERAERKEDRGKGKGEGAIDDFRLTIDYCISTQRTQRYQWHKKISIDGDMLMVYIDCY